MGGRGGAEWMATSNILVRAEYLYYGISGVPGWRQLQVLACEVRWAATSLEVASGPMPLPRYKTTAPPQ
jgi:hypothetical protein